MLEHGIETGRGYLKLTPKQYANLGHPLKVLTVQRANESSLNKLAVKLGLDRTNAVRYCIARVLEIKGIASESKR